MREEVSDGPGPPGKEPCESGTDEDGVQLLGVLESGRVADEGAQHEAHEAGDAAVPQVGHLVQPQVVEPRRARKKQVQMCSTQVYHTT